MYFFAEVVFITKIFEFLKILETQVKCGTKHQKPLSHNTTVLCHDLMSTVNQIILG